MAFSKRCKNMSTKQEIVFDATFKAWLFHPYFKFACENCQVTAVTCKYQSIGFKPYHYQVARSSILNEAKHWKNTEKHWDYLTGLVFALWYVGFGLKKISDYLIRLELILYVGIDLEKYSNYLTRFGLTLSV